MWHDGRSSAMDRVPRKLPNNSSRLIAMAASLVGEAELVRQEMECSQADFRAYCTGRREPPIAELDRLIQLIVREQGKEVARNRELLSQARARDGKAVR